MANTPCYTTSFKRELLCGIHAFGATVVRAATTKDSFKGALYLNTATLDATVGAYTATGEATGTGYVAGGNAITNATDPATSGTSAFWTPSASLVFTPVTIGPVDALLIYNSTQGNKSVGIYTFSSLSVVAGTLTLTMPANAAATALIQQN